MLHWEGDLVLARVRAAQRSGIDTTMAACVLNAKSNHGLGAHAERRFITRTAELERSMRIVQKAHADATGVEGVWGSTGVIYARRIELGFQGKDRAGRVVDAPPYPFLRPAAQVEYPKLADRIRRAL